MVILICLISFLIIYTLIRDCISKRKRKRDLLITKRNSKKLDVLNSEVKKQNDLFQKLLDILDED